MERGGRAQYGSAVTFILTLPASQQREGLEIEDLCDCVCVCVDVLVCVCSRVKTPLDDPARLSQGILVHATMG